MLSLLAALLLAAVSPRPAATNQADLSVVIPDPSPGDAWQTSHFSLIVANAGPDTVLAPQLTVTVSGAQAYCSYVPTLAPGFSATVDCQAVLTSHSATISSITAHVASDLSDPYPPNNDATSQIRWIVGPRFQVSLYGPGIELLDPGAEYAFNVFYRNENPVAATNSVVTIDVPEGSTVVKTPVTCSVSGSTVTCPVGTVTSHNYSTIPLTFRGPDRDDGVVSTVRATATSDEPPASTAERTGTVAVTFYRMFHVENTNDTGSGSLRAAIEAANASCLNQFPCKIAFGLGDPGPRGWHTITPLSELPEIHAGQISVDAASQTRSFGDTNPDGPEVFLDGANVKSGSGLSFIDPCRAEVTSLAVGNFPGNGIDVRAREYCSGSYYLAPSRIVNSYAGLDPSGRTAAPNERGIALATPQSMTIQGNVISANRRSGLYVVNGPHAVLNNVIGLDAHHELPMGNGASGIYVAAGVYYFDVSGNYIAFNHDFGIGIDRTAKVDIHPNAIFANWQMAIDIGLDGPTDSPVISAAVYDPVNRATTIDITYAEGSTFSSTLQFYAADAPGVQGHGDAQYYVGTARPPRTNSGTSSYRFVADGDWRGKWVSASVTRNIYNGFSEDAYDLSATSELSNAIEVH